MAMAVAYSCLQLQLLPPVRWCRGDACVAVGQPLLTYCSAVQAEAEARAELEAELGSGSDLEEGEEEEPHFAY